MYNSPNLGQFSRLGSDFFRTVVNLGTKSVRTSSSILIGLEKTGIDWVKGNNLKINRSVRIQTVLFIKKNYDVLQSNSIN